MTRTAYEARPRDELLEGIAVEFLHHAPRGRRLIAVEAAMVTAPATAPTAAITATVDAARFADDLAAALHAHGQTVVRASVFGTDGSAAADGSDETGGPSPADETTLRTVVVEPFRAGTLPGASDDAVLIVDGWGLLDDAVRGIWHFSVWLLAGDELPHSGASVIVDVTDSGAPKRFYYDYCALPPSVNRPGLH